MLLKAQREVCVEITKGNNESAGFPLLSLTHFLRLALAPRLSLVAQKVFQYHKESGYWAELAVSLKMTVLKKKKISFIS